MTPDPMEEMFCQLIRVDAKPIHHGGDQTAAILYFTNNIPCPFSPFSVHPPNEGGEHEHIALILVVHL